MSLTVCQSRRHSDRNGFYHDKTQKMEGQITHYESITTENSAAPFGFDWLDGTRSLHQQPGSGFESRASSSIIRRFIYCAPSRPVGVWERDSFIIVYMLKPKYMAWCVVSVYLLRYIDYLWPDQSQPQHQSARNFPVGGKAGPLTRRTQ